MESVKNSVSAIMEVVQARTGKEGLHLNFTDVRQNVLAVALQLPSYFWNSHGYKFKLERVFIVSNPGQLFRYRIYLVELSVFTHLMFAWIVVIKRICNCNLVRLLNELNRKKYIKI